MNDELNIQGSLEETTVPDLFRTVIRNGETAVLSLDAIGRRDVVYFENGRIVFATTSDTDLGLAEVLFRSGDLTYRQFDDLNERVISADRVGAVLCELGYLQPEELSRALESQVCRIVLQALSFRSGTYDMTFTEVLADDVVHLSINHERLVLDGTARVEHWSLVERGIGTMHRVLAQVPGADARIYHLDLSDEESHVYSLLGESATVAEICQRSYLSDFTTCRSLWGLLAVDLITDASTDVVNLQRAASENEMELEELVERFNGAYVETFQLVFQQIGDHIYDFLDRVVSNLSPRIAPLFRGITLVNDGRVDFDQVLNNLISSAAEDKRGVLNEGLNELLYGWILEMKAEFGDRLDSEMALVVARLRR